MKQYKQKPKKNNCNKVDDRKWSRRKIRLTTTWLHRWSMDGGTDLKLMSL